MSDYVVENRSFCTLYKDSHNQKVWLRRLLDIQGTELKVPEINEGEPKIFGNRPTLYWNWNNGPQEVGTYGVWGWTAKRNSTGNGYSQDLINTIFIEDRRVIEVVLVPGVSSREDLAKVLREGVPGHTVCSRVLFCFHKSGRSIEGILCNNSEIDKKSDGKTYVCDTVNRLPVYSFLRSDVLHPRNEERTFYRKLELDSSEGTILIKAPTDIVRNIIFGRINKNSTLLTSLGISRPQRQIFRELIKELPSEPLYQNVASECHCSAEEAKGYVEQFLANVDRYISQDYYDHNVLAQIVEEHLGLWEKYELLASKKWEKVHKDTASEINKQKAELASVIKDVKLQEKKLTDLKKIVAGQEKLATTISEKMKSKIEEARKDVASFISDGLFASIFGALGGSEKNPAGRESPLQDGVTLTTKYVNGDWKDAVGTLEIELENAGIVEKYRYEFASFLYSAYINNVPILLAGPNAKNISDAFSAAFFGKTTGVIDCSGPYCPEVINEITKSEDEIFMIMNAFRNDWITHIPELLSMKKYFFIVHPFAEDLLIEPKTLFSYVMPVLTELVVSDKPKRQVGGAKRKTDYKDYIKPDKAGKDPRLEKILKSLGYGALVRSQLKTVLADFHQIIDSDNTDLDCLFVIFAYAFISGLSKTELVEKLDSMKISGDLKKELKFFMGISDE